ncbi:hypothetical protein NDU88_002190 [Pleurodeles waltl]|uniref:Uncharacterized protein n=1 Tax=Pleurodeles waltl TaxID=8319 RepID=A0AAV7M0T6_PLEWA|nr:hypothetical protein NDU88_002190 [Pleurodeles waltl]
MEDRGGTESSVWTSSRPCRGSCELRTAAHENLATQQRNNLPIGTWEEHRIYAAGPDAPGAAMSPGMEGDGSRNLTGMARRGEDSTGWSPGTATGRLEPWVQHGLMVGGKDRSRGS